MRLNLSYSSLKLLHQCARKYELEKMSHGEGIDDMSIDLVAGKSFDAGIARYWETNSFEEAVAAAYFAWTFPNGPNRQSWSISETSKKKAFYLVVKHLEKYHATRPLEALGFELWYLPNGRPATQVGFRVALPGGKYYRGFIDAIFRSKVDGIFAPIEVKTSGLDDTPRAIYQNSFQGISYSFVTDYITGIANPIQYNFVAEFPKCEQQLFDFYRSPQNKVSWLPSLAYDCQDLERYIANEHFPMNGDGCFNYFRPCKHLGVCDLSRTNAYREHSEEDPALYDFNFTLEELLDARDRLYP